MQILSVTLTNFKTHKEKQFDFELGTNAICGENGAGKTSILEAIAWVLFYYQGNYKKEDLIRNGANNAQARVAFISSRDSRTYEVQRSTSGGYIIFDPQLNERLPYTRTKDEVLPWLRQHLGVAPSTDLAQLFANTIGVPQGTFTVDFLLPTEKRKPIFDTVLKVEEYRETYKQSNTLRKYSEAQSQRLKDLITQYEESLENWDTLQTSYEQLKGEIKIGEIQLVELEKKAKKLAEQSQNVKETAEKIQATQQQQQSVAERIQAQQQAKARIEVAIETAQKATDICKQEKPAYEKFLAVEVKINLLNEQAQARQKLLHQQQQQQQSTAKSQRELSKLEAKLEQFSTAEKDLAALEAEVAKQTQLEKKLSDLQEQSQQFISVRLQQKSLNEQAQRVAREISQTETELKRLATLLQTIEQIPEWEEEQIRIQQQLSRVEAAQQFKREIKGLVDGGTARQDLYRQQVVNTLAELDGWASEYAGLSKETIAPIKETLFQGGLISKDLLDSLNDILDDLSTQVDRKQLQRQQRETQNQLRKAYAQQAESMAIESQQAKQIQLIEQQQKIRETLIALEKQLETEANATQTLQQLETQIRALDNPKGKQQLLQKTLQQQADVQQQHDSLVAAQKDAVTAAKSISTQLQAFESLDAQMGEKQTEKQVYQAGYLLFLQNQQAAKNIEETKLEADAIDAELTQLTSEETRLTAQVAALSETFDPAAFATLETQLSAVTSQADQLKGRLPQLQTRFTELTTRIESLKTTAEKRDQAQVALKKCDRIKRFVNYARKVYKEAGPRITERYVHNISREADRLFRELLGRQNVALTWSADYEITVQEGAHTRRFINLSGGEQMCAALAVRLALLKVLADIDVAFFDEPTTNMDRPRRASLAEAIARIKSFKQIFVISHDDTFEQVTETVIQVTRDN